MNKKVICNHDGIKNRIKYINDCRSHRNHHCRKVAAPLIPEFDHTVKSRASFYTRLMQL